MRFIITESQVEKLCKVFEKFIATENYEGICDVDVDYDDTMDRFVLNIFFDRRFAVEKGRKFDAHMKKVIGQMYDRFIIATSYKPFLYVHYKDCN